MKQLTVVSGKGGTGKTVLAACFAMLAQPAVVVDCDVDAANLHLLLHPSVKEHHLFSGGSVAFKDRERCTACGRCLESCRFGAITASLEIDQIRCEGCGFCVRVCPEQALILKPVTNGEWYVSETRFGPMVHARLGIAEENSGKLVSLIRKRAQEVALLTGAEYVIADGPPGIGCPVIASITGADLVLGVAEPTLSGIHDLKRLAGVVARFGIKMCCVVNKYDINQVNTTILEKWCQGNSIEVVGKIPYEETVTKALVMGKTVLEYNQSQVAKEIGKVWNRVACILSNLISKTEPSARA